VVINCLREPNLVDRDIHYYMQEPGFEPPDISLIHIEKGESQ